MEIHPQQTKTLTEAQTNSFQEILDELLGMKGVNHAVMAVENRDGSFRWSGAKGSAQPDGTPMTTDTPFWIASITKLFIASSVLKLYETNQLSIDDLVIKHLPDDLLKGVHVVKGVDYYDQITLNFQYL